MAAAAHAMTRQTLRRARATAPADPTQSHAAEHTSRVAPRRRCDTPATWTRNATGAKCDGPRICGARRAENYKESATQARRLRAAASPASPRPSNARLAGSGTPGVGGCTVPLRTWKMY